MRNPPTAILLHSYLLDKVIQIHSIHSIHYFNSNFIDFIDFMGHLVLSRWRKVLKWILFKWILHCLQVGKCWIGPRWSYCWPWLQRCRLNASLIIPITSRNNQFLFCDWTFVSVDDQFDWFHLIASFFSFCFRAIFDGWLTFSDFHQIRWRGRFLRTPRLFSER